ncbi:hypothetical protein ACJX0J_024732, partial [Zea mays]
MNIIKYCILLYREHVGDSHRHITMEGITEILCHYNPELLALEERIGSVSTALSEEQGSAISVILLDFTLSTFFPMSVPSHWYCCAGIPVHEDPDIHFNPKRAVTAVVITRARAIQQSQAHFSESVRLDVSQRLQVLRMLLANGNPTPSVGCQAVHSVNWGQVQLPVIILLKLQLNCCQIEDGQLRDISFLNITKECIRTQNLAANKYKHISARTIYVLNFQWLPKNPQTLIVGNTKIPAMIGLMFFLCVLALLKIKAAYANPIDGIDGSIHIQMLFGTLNCKPTTHHLRDRIGYNYKETWIKSNEKEAFAPPNYRTRSALQGMSMTQTTIAYLISSRDFGLFLTTP